MSRAEITEKKEEDKLQLDNTKKVREYWSEHARIFIEFYDDEPNECVFTHLWVVDEQRRKGYGKQALMQAEEIAKELGCHIAYLKVETNSWMHKWYLKCGYKWYKNAPDNYTWLIKNLNNMGYQFKDKNGVNMGEVSDGYHTFNELYEYRLLYNASMFNELAKQGLYDVHKSKRHSNGEFPFGDSNWFIVMAELPTGQISNHYEMKDWELFQIPEKEKANKWDGHTPQDAIKRMRNFLKPKPKYPKTYEECCEILNIDSTNYLELIEKYSKFKNNITSYENNLSDKINTLYRLIICRNAFWKIYSEENDLDQPWEPNFIDKNQPKCSMSFFCGKIIKCSNPNTHRILTFPTKEMTDIFVVHFKTDIDICEDLL